MSIEYSQCQQGHTFESYLTECPKCFTTAHNGQFKYFVDNPYKFVPVWLFKEKLFQITNLTLGKFGWCYNYFTPFKGHELSESSVFEKDDNTSYIATIDASYLIDRVGSIVGFK